MLFELDNSCVVNYQRHSHTLTVMPMLPVLRQMVLTCGKLQQERTILRIIETKIAFIAAVTAGKAVQHCNFLCWHSYQQNWEYCGPYFVSSLTFVTKVGHRVLMNGKNLPTRCPGFESWALCHVNYVCCWWSPCSKGILRLSSLTPSH